MDLFDVSERASWFILIETNWLFLKDCLKIQAAHWRVRARVAPGWPQMSKWAWGMSSTGRGCAMLHQHAAGEGNEPTRVKGDADRAAAPGGLYQTSLVLSVIQAFF